MGTIDNLDRKILSIITRNARIASKDVAQVCGVSRAAVHQRIQRMIDVGVITGSCYTVAPEVLGYNLCAYVGIRLVRAAAYRDAVAQIEQIPEVVECHVATGRYSLLVKLYAHDNDRLKEIVVDHLNAIEGVVETETLLSLEKSFLRNVSVKVE